MASTTIRDLVSSVDPLQEDPPNYVFSNGRSFKNYDIPTAIYSGQSDTAITDGAGLGITDGNGNYIEYGS